MLLKNFKIQFYVFIILSVLLLVEGFFYYYSYKLINLCADDFKFSMECHSQIFDGNTTGFNPIIWNENRLVEVLQFILLFFCLLNLLKLYYFKNSLSKSNIRYFTILYFLAILYFFFEEISWGQHLFQWESGNFFIQYNNQDETNFHNISNLLDQVPRTLLALWCVACFLIFQPLKKLFLSKNYLFFILPHKNLKYISLLVITFCLPDLIFDKFGIHPGHTGDTVHINLTDICDFFSFNFIKL